MSFKNEYIYRKAESHRFRITYIKLNICYNTNNASLRVLRSPNLFSEDSNNSHGFTGLVSDALGQRSLINVVVRQSSYETPPAGIRWEHGLCIPDGHLFHYFTEREYVDLVIIMMSPHFWGHVCKVASSHGSPLSW